MARRTKAEAEETKQRLLDAAEQVFSKQGVSSSTLDDIASLAGTTRGAIQWHFKDKTGLLASMLERASAPIQTLVLGKITANQALPLTTIVATFAETLRMLEEDERTRNVLMIALHMLEYTPELASLRTSNILSQKAAAVEFQKSLAAGARLHNLKLRGDVKLAGRALSVLLFGMLNSWVLHPAAFDLQKSGRAALETYLLGLGFDENSLRPYGLCKPVRRTARSGSNSAV